MSSPHRAPLPEGINPAIRQDDGKRGNGEAERFFEKDVDWTKPSTVPNRYHIRQEGKTRILTCVEAPTVTVRAERGLAISATEARKYRAGTIFLDGAAQGDPFIDVQKELYNLDHHEGCIRSLATCEQAMVLIRKGLDLSKRDWVVLANDADLDTVFALWALLNHNRLSDRSNVRAKIMPLLRLAGVVDAHGRDAQDLAALPPDLLHSTNAMLKQLQQQESVIKDYDRWSETDLAEYIADRLHAIDELIYVPEDFDGFHEVEELARAQIANGSIAVACRSNADIEQVQRQLQRIYGQRLGILIFQDGSSAYSVRQVDRNLPATLERAYERLNLLDPAVTGGSENRWSGSADMGASPRKTGTNLSATQIIEAVREAFWEPSLVDVISAIPRALFLAAGALLPALALIFVGNLLRDRGYIAGETVLLSVVVLTVTAGILFWSKARPISRAKRLACACELWLAQRTPRRTHRRCRRRDLGSRIARLSDGIRQPVPSHRCRCSAASAGGRAAFPRRDSRRSRRTPADTKKRRLTRAFMAYFDIGRHLRRGFTLTVPECLKGRDPNYSIASHRRRLRYLRYRVRHSARAFREYLGIRPAPLALHGGIVTVPPFAVLRISFSFI